MNGIHWMVALSLPVVFLIGCDDSAAHRMGAVDAALTQVADADPAPADCCPALAAEVAAPLCCPTPCEDKAKAAPVAAAETPSCCPAPGGNAADAAAATAKAIEENVTRKLGPLAAAPLMQLSSPITGKPTVGEWSTPEDRDVFDLNFTVTDQEGREHKLKDLMDRPAVMSFIFTRCSNPEMCPTITIQMAHLQRDLEKQGLSDKVRLLLLSYDPVYDTPQRLKKWGADRGLRFDNAVMLRPSVEQYRDLISELAISVAPLADGTFNHTYELLLLDAQGRFVRDYRGDIWNNEPVIEDLRKLVTEAGDKQLSAR